jgi:hypothetical protein
MYVDGDGLKRHYNDQASAILLRAGGTRFYNTTASAEDVAFTPKTSMYISELGKVGIGTASPDKTLSVAGNAIIGQDVTSGFSYIYLGEEADADKCLVFGYDHDNNWGGFCIGGESLSTGGLNIANGGNVGIGTSSPDGKLHVYNTSTTSDGDGTATMTASGQDSLLLYGHGGVDDATYGGITWMGGGRRRGMITAVAENTDPDFIGLAFYTQGTDGPGDFSESMRISHSGKVGIGTTDPTTALSVMGDLVLASADDPYIAFTDADQAQNNMALRYDTGQDAMIWRDNGVGSDRYYLYRDGRHLIQGRNTAGNFNSGVVEIDNEGTSADGCALVVDTTVADGHDDRGPFQVWQSGNGHHLIKTVNTGNIYRYPSTTTTWDDSSDVRIKKNVVNLKGEGLSIINQLRPVRFDYTDDFIEAENLEPRLQHSYGGFIANEVREVLPDIVTEGTKEIGGETWDDFLSMNETCFNSIMMASIQELSDKVDALEISNAELRAQVSGSS